MLTDDKFLEKLGRNIESLGRAKFKTQDDFSTACEIDTRTLRRIIKQEQNPTVLVLRKIARGLEISLSELVDV
jgi:transcriptional regulator with XRE-family HTH domain